MNIFILPSKNKNNKYISLLVDSIRNLDKNLNVPDLRYDTVGEIFSSYLLKSSKNTKNIIHIQWPTVIYGSHLWVKSIFLMFFNFSLLLIAKFFLRTKIVWTIHNFHAHDYENRKLDILGMSILRKIADSIIVQQKSTCDDFIKKYPLKNIEYIPHGNYIGAYGDKVEKDILLKRSLGFEDSDVVVTSLGAIARYKKNENIIKAVTDVRKKYSNLKLLVIGKGKINYVEELESLVLDDGINIENIFVPDRDIPKYLSVSDYAIFYYDKSEMTSGGIILALSYGVPVISRDIPGAEMIDKDSGLIFNDDNQLREVLISVCGKLKEADSGAIIRRVIDFDWHTNSKKLLEIYKEI